jgi:16S rRNA processing protein RimM
MVEQFLDWADLVALGEIAKAHGRYGEVILNTRSDQPERFSRLLHVFVEGADGRPEAVEVESARIHKGRPVVKLACISSIGDAAALVGKELRIPESELDPLPDGSIYHFDIVGATVEDRKRGVIGVVEKVISTGGTDVLVVRSADDHEQLLPLCDEICRRIDRDARRIEIDAPEGLIGLNAH